MTSKWHTEAFSFRAFCHLRLIAPNLSYGEISILSSNCQHISIFGTNWEGAEFFEWGRSLLGLVGLVHVSWVEREHFPASLHRWSNRSVRCFLWDLETNLCGVSKFQTEEIWCRWIWVSSVSCIRSRYMCGNTWSGEVSRLVSDNTLTGVRYKSSPLAINPIILPSIQWTRWA